MDLMPDNALVPSAFTGRALERRPIPFTSAPIEIIQAILFVMQKVNYIQKTGWNDFQKFKYVSVGALLEQVQPAMAEAGLVILQFEASREFLDNKTALAITYDFVLTHSSGAIFPAAIPQVGISGCRNSKGGFDDKAAAKCHTAARKYLILGLFQIPTGELPDGDLEEAYDQPTVRSKRLASEKSNAAADANFERERVHSRDKVAEALERRLKASFVSVIQAARSKDPNKGIAILRAWKKDREGFASFSSDPRFSEPWGQVDSEIVPALRQAFGETFAKAWRASLTIFTHSDLALLRQRWGGEWYTDLMAVRQAHPEAHYLLGDHTRFMAERIGTEDGTYEPAIDHQPEPSLAEPAPADEPPPLEVAPPEPPAETGPQFEAFLIDQHGEPRPEPYATPVDFAQNYINLWLSCLDVAEREALAEHNAEALHEVALADPRAMAEILSCHPLGRPAAALLVDPPRQPGGEIFLAGYLGAIEQSLAEIEKYEMATWEQANEPVYGQLPQKAKLRILQLIATKRKAFGLEAKDAA